MNCFSPCRLLRVVAFTLLFGPALAARPDILLADFEGDTYGKWEATGDAIVPGPAHGTFPHQQLVHGYWGSGLVNTYRDGDKPTGRLRSPGFTIERPYINFLIGGGEHPTSTCVVLLVDGHPVRRAFGFQNDRLTWETWDVRELAEQRARVEIVDAHSGPWGHILVDHLVQSDEPKARPRPTLVTAGEFSKIYDPGVGETESWYINDHCFVKDPEGGWHLFGITHTDPPRPLEEDDFAHATADSLLQSPWVKQPYALSAVADPWGETHLWAPHIIRHNGTWHMYYCAGDPDHTRYKIHLATSTDLKSWTRHPENPMVVDGVDARDPFILRVGDRWVMYYTATSEPEGGNYIVAAVTSTDLVHWEGRKIVFFSPERGTYGGSTESPFVVRRGSLYYLFLGPRGSYDGTSVYVSGDPMDFQMENRVGWIPSHAAEVVRDVDGKWYVSRCGWRRKGVYLAPLSWHDGLDTADTSLPAPE